MEAEDSDVRIRRWKGFACYSVELLLIYSIQTDMLWDVWFDFGL